MGCFCAVRTIWGSSHFGGAVKKRVFYSPSNISVGIPAIWIRSWSVLPFISGIFYLNHWHIEPKKDLVTKPIRFGLQGLFNVVMLKRETFSEVKNTQIPLHYSLFLITWNSKCELSEKREGNSEVKILNAFAFRIFWLPLSDLNGRPSD